MVAVQLSAPNQTAAVVYARGGAGKSQQRGDQQKHSICTAGAVTRLSRRARKRKQMQGSTHLTPLTAKRVDPTGGGGAQGSAAASSA